MNTHPDVVATGELAAAIAILAEKTIGPDGTLTRCDMEDAPLIRSMFCSRIAEAAMRILDQRLESE